MEWILPTPTPYLLVEPVQVVEVSSSEKDPEEDLEGEPEELYLEPDVEIQDISEIDEDPIIDLDSPEEFILVPEVESIEDSGPGWLVESDSSLGGDGHLELTPMAQAPPLVVETDSSQSSTEFAVVLDIDLLGPSRDACIVIPSDSSSAGDTNGLSLSDSPSCSTAQ